MIPVPKTVAEMGIVADDAAKLVELGEALQHPEWVLEYTKNVASNDPGLETQKTAANEAVIKRTMEEHGLTPDVLARVKRLPMSEEDGGLKADPYRGLNLKAWEKRQAALTGEGPGVELTGQFGRLADFVKLLAAAGPTSEAIMRGGLDARLKVLGEGQGDQGGFLVPEEFRAQLFQLALEQSVVRPRATVIPMTGLTVVWPAIRDTTHASNVFGGVTATWIPEAGAIGQTEPTFSQIRLTAQKLAAGTRVNNELVKDSAIGLEALINTLFPRAMAWVEDDAFINGIGGGQPVGILNADALVSVAKETGQAATTLVVENVIKMFSRMLPQSLPNSVWVMNSDVVPELYTMSLSVGTGGAPMFFPSGGIGSAPGGTLLGRPIVFTEKCQTLGTSGDIYLVDFSQYLIGDRQAMEMASSIHTRFNTDQTDFRLISRLTGRPWLDSALTPKNSLNTLSPFVALATRS